MTAAEIPPPIERGRDPLEAGLAAADELLVCLDYDGTLAPIVEDPDDASMTAANRRALEACVAEPSVTVAVVSGRGLADVRRRVDLPVTVAGNHGLELERNGSTAIHPIAARRSRTIGTVCTILETSLDSIPNCRVEDKGLTGTVHVRSVPEPARELVHERTREVIERVAGDELTCSTGKRVVEFSPSLSWGKGDAVSLLEADRSTETFTIYVGDDTTDEHAFEAVEPDGVGVLVGPPRPSHASRRVEAPADVASLVSWLAKTAPDLLTADEPSRRSSSGKERTFEER